MNPIASVGNAVGNSRATFWHSDSLVCGTGRVVGALIGANVNQTNTDIAIPLFLLPGCNYIISKVFLNGASISLTTATFGVFSGAGATGVTIVTAGAVLSSLTSSTSNQQATLAATATTTVLNQTTAPVLYLRIGTAQGAAATVDIYVVADILP